MRKFILHYARIAAEEDVALFCIGTELTAATTKREADWRRVIQKVRAEYEGPLVYAANWWEEYEQIGFWDALDYVGINAFFPLSQSAGPSLSALRKSAASVADSIALTQARTRRPVIFTEVGFKSVRGASVEPWRWTRRRDAVDMEEQLRCYQAVFEVFWNRPWFYGMYWWKWYSDLDTGGPNHAGFTPRHKLAEELLADWYTRPTRLNGR